MSKISREHAEAQASIVINIFILATSLDLLALQATREVLADRAKTPDGLARLKRIDALIELIDTLKVTTRIS